ncbi:hypothetical protein BLA15816_04769 [Burkholderia lata]|nr:hypothetical protein BLA15816_04769 [Burkholderia lata]
MKKLLHRLWRHLNRPLSTPEIRETDAYKAGFDAWYKHELNPHKANTDSHLHWTLGYRDAEHWESMLW